MLPLQVPFSRPRLANTSRSLDTDADALADWVPELKQRLRPVRPVLHTAGLRIGLKLQHAWAGHPKAQTKLRRCVLPWVAAVILAER